MRSNYNPFSLSNKTVLITGAASGIGRTTAVECAKMGATLVLLDINEAGLKETIEMLEGAGHHSLKIDLTNEEAIVALVNELPQLDGCVNNAGITKLQMTQFIEKETFQRILDINTLAPIILTRQLVKKRRFNKGASIVFTSSVAGNFRASIGNGMYAASKAAISAFMRNAAIELAPKSIRCNAVNPAMVYTNILGTNLESDEQAQQDMKSYPLKRYGKPEEVAYAIIYFLSDASAFSTGSSLVLDGGKTIQ